MNRRRKLIVPGLCVVAVGLAIGGCFLYRDYRSEKEARLTSQCANHAIQHKMTLALLLHENASYQFSSETNTRRALAPVTQNPLAPGADWLSVFASACPESFDRDGSIGYLFLADGLKVDGSNEDPAIVLICPAKNHQGSSEHCHAVMTSGMECLKSNAEALQLLREHLGKATNGVIRYSANAQAIMKREIEAREGFERRMLRRRI